ncbi:MAG TPA: calcium/sodium antiporter [Proteobacteria bacterium]|nr:calcium/sodium antiporter [Pseudomonadota bacterium]
MLAAFLAVVLGLGLLVWSADHFIEGSAATARHFGMPPLLIGMVIIGFGTSAPEMVVSALAAFQGNPGLAVGNAYGSNISNIALILGLTALINPITIHSQVLRREIPLLLAVTALAAWQFGDDQLTRGEALVLLGVFGALMVWTIHQGLKSKTDPLSHEIIKTLENKAVPLEQSVSRLLVGLVLLIVSSRLLVWGAVAIAQAFGVSDLVIGLTIVAVGTSLPELASSMIATRKGEHDLALGNILGSNLFNTLAVVGIAGAIQPLRVAPEVLYRDIPFIAGLTVSLLILSYRFRQSRRGNRINRFAGASLLTAYLAYTAYLIRGFF